MTDQEACENKIIDELKARKAGDVFLSHESDGIVNKKENKERSDITDDVMRASKNACEGLGVAIGYQTIPGIGFDLETGEARALDIPSFHIFTQPTTPKKGGVDL